MKLSGWGRYPVVDCRIINARDERDVIRAVEQNAALIARGNGRSYGDAAINPNATLLMRRLNRFLSFDASTGDMECEAGVLLSDILSVFVPRGWFPPVTPGTQYVTVGGMIAADVHGKNHHKEGSIGRHIHSMRVVTADGIVTTCSRETNQDLFWATIGGMGLTGVIVSARLSLKRIETAYILETRRKRKNLQEALSAFEDATPATYSVAWIDCLSSGASLGRSILITGEHARIPELPQNKQSRPLMIEPKSNLSIPFNLPSFTLNRWSVKAFNAVYYGKLTPGVRLVDYDEFFYPLDTIKNWNRIYGRRGFVQFQFIIPKEKSLGALQQILKEVAAARQGSFLAVLKLLGPSNKYLSFPMEGYTLSLDFPATDKSFTTIEQLEQIVLNYGGRFYLAKDARIALDTFNRSEPRSNSFREWRATNGAARSFSSLQSQRLAL